MHSDCDTRYDKTHHNTESQISFSLNNIYSTNQTLI